MKNLQIKIFSISLLLFNQVYNASFVKPLVASSCALFAYDKYKNIKESMAHQALMRYTLNQRDYKKFFELLSQCEDYFKTLWITSLLQPDPKDPIFTEYKFSNATLQIDLFDLKLDASAKNAFYEYIKNDTIPQAAVDNIFKSHDIKAIQAVFQAITNNKETKLLEILKSSDEKRYSSQAIDFLTKNLSSLLSKKDDNFFKEHADQVGYDFISYRIYVGSNQTPNTYFPASSDEYQKLKKQSWMTEELLQKLIINGMISPNTGYHLALQNGYKKLSQLYMDTCIYDKLYSSSPERLLKIMHDYHRFNQQAVKTFYETARKTSLESYKKDSSWTEYITGNDVSKMQNYMPKVIKPEVMIETLLSTDYSIPQTKSYSDEYSFHGQADKFTEKTYALKNFLEYLIDQEFVDPTAYDQVLESAVYQYITNGCHPLLSRNFYNVIAKCPKKDITNFANHMMYTIESPNYNPYPQLIDKTAKCLLTRYVDDYTNKNNYKNREKIDKLQKTIQKIDENSVENLLNIEKRSQAFMKAVEQGFN